MGSELVDPLPASDGEPSVIFLPASFVTSVASRSSLNT